MIINTTELGKLVITQPNTELPPIRILLNVASNGVGVPPLGEPGQVLRKSSATNFDTEWSNENVSTWGAITGELSSQTDLQEALDAKQSVSGMANYLTVSQASSGYYPSNNPAGYLISADLSDYLTSASANATYYPLGNNPAGYLTSGSGANLFYPKNANPAGYLTSSALSGYLTPSSGASLFYPLNANPSGYITETVLDDFLTTTEASEVYQTQANMAPYVTDIEAELKLGPYFLPKSGGTMNANALQIFPTDSFGMDSELGAWGLGIEQPSTGKVAFLSADTLSVATNGTGTEVTSSGIKFPNGVTQTVGFVPSDYLTASAVASGYYPLSSNPAGYLTSSALVPYATLVSPILTGDPKAPTPLTSDNDTSIATTAFVKAQGYATSVSVASGYYPLSSNPAGYLTSSALTPYATLAGATFTGKVNITTNVNLCSINIGSGKTAGLSGIAGDIWIEENYMHFRDNGGSDKTLANTNSSNTFANINTFNVTSNSNYGIALTQSGNGGGVRITNLGTGESLRVEDETNPDASPFVISNTGRVGIGIAPDATVALKIDSTGLSFNGLVVKPTSVANPLVTSGNMAHQEYLKELLINIGGVNYAIPLRVV